MGMATGVLLLAAIGITKFRAISAQGHRLPIGTSIAKIGTSIAISLPVNDDYRPPVLKPLLAEVQEQCAK